MKRVKIGLLGCGTVGSGFVKLLDQQRSSIRRRHDVDVSISRILVRDRSSAREGIDRELLTDRADEVIERDCDIVVELIGGIDPTRSFIYRSLAARKHVVTANKRLLARRGRDLFDLAAVHRVRIGFEASVCGAIPIIRVLRNGVGDRVQSIRGILNGTCNYILTRMSEDELSFEEALAAARRNGFAEADPSLDIDGHDAAEKLKILSELAFGTSLSLDDVRLEGIGSICEDDVAHAKARGLVLRHVATAQLDEDCVRMRVAVEALDRSDTLAAVRNEQNAILIGTECSGELALFGKGAGALPSASAVLADVVELAVGA